MLGGMLGGGAQPAGGADGESPLAGKGALMAMLLPLAMQWVQRNGGVGGLLDRFKQQGYGQQAASWVSTGENQPLSADAVHEVLGSDEISQLSQKLGVPTEHVAGGLAELLPQLVNQLTPSGEVTPDADNTLTSSLSSLTQMFGR
jgi:uncharacterized protein YidB (DUF937 family)